MLDITFIDLTWTLSYIFEILLGCSTSWKNESVEKMVCKEPLFMFDKFHLTFNFKPKVSRDIFQNKNECQLTSTSFLKGHLNVMCLIVRVISVFEVSIDTLLFSSQVTLHVKILVVRVNWRAIYVGARFCVSNVKNFVKNTHSKEYWDIFQSKWYVYTHCPHDKCRQKPMQMMHDKIHNSLFLFNLIRHFTPKKSPTY